VKGDANGDGKLNIADPIRILVVLFVGASGFDCQDAADANDEGSIDVSDAIFLLFYQFMDGADVPEPFLPLQCITLPVPRWAASGRIDQ
jgi:hypothetical protein